MAKGDIKKHSTYRSVFLGGKIRLFANRSWVTHSDRSSKYDFDKVVGRSTKPSLTWATDGIPVREGETLKTLIIDGRGTTAYVNDIEVKVFASYPKEKEYWHNGVSSTSQMIFEEIDSYQLMDDKDGVLKNKKYRHKKELDYRGEKDCEIILCFRATARQRGNREFSGKIRLDIE